MKELSYRVNVMQIQATWERCGNLLQSTRLSLMSNPPWYVHKCRGCGAEENLRKVYPYIAYEEIGSECIAVMD